MRKVVALTALAAVLAFTGQAGAALSASATVSSQQVGPNSWQYSLTLQNSGTTPIGTYWFGWVPLYDLLPSMPTSINSPNGWAGTAAADYFGVGSAQWVNTANPLQPGASMSGFQFTSPDSPSALNGMSFGFPIGDSYVYKGAPEAPGDPGFFFQTSTVPEPASLALAGVATAIVLARRRRS